MDLDKYSKYNGYKDYMTQEKFDEFVGDDIGAYLYWVTMWAGSWCADYRRIQKMIDTGSDPNKYFSTYGNPKALSGISGTPLYLALRPHNHGAKFVIKTLLDNGADIGIPGINETDSLVSMWIKNSGKKWEWEWKNKLILWHQNRRWSDFFALI